MSFPEAFEKKRPNPPGSPLQLVRLILNQNYFVYNNEFYEEKDGVAMGAPLSYTIACIFLNNLEETHIMSNKNPFLSAILFYGRYVDDTLFLLKLTKRQITNLVKYVNSISPHIKFTFEIMVDNKINFMDLTINIVNQKMEFSIYRKPTCSDVVINNNSDHPISKKHAAFHSLAHRAANVPMSKENLHKELDNIRHIGKVNGYPLYIINKIIDKHIKQANTEDNNTQIREKQKFKLLTYYNNFSNKIGNIYRQHGFTPAFKTKNNIRNTLYNVNKNYQADKNLG